MSNQTSKTIQTPLPDEEAVAEFLLENLDFFEHHLELLEEIKVPHPSGSAISLVERQIAQLRSQNLSLHDKLQSLIEVARENDRLAERIQHLTLALLDADNLQDALQTLRDTLSDNFDADRVEMRLFGESEQLVQLACNEVTDPNDPALAPFENFLQTARPVSGRLKQSQLEYLFQDRADEIKSAVLLPIGQNDTIGILAIGSIDPLRFEGGTGTTFLTHLGEVIASVIRHHLRQGGNLE